MRTDLARFQDESFIAGAASDFLAIEKIQQGNGVFARKAGKNFECRHVDQAVRRRRVGRTADDLFGLHPGQSTTAPWRLPATDDAPRSASLDG